MSIENLPEKSLKEKYISKIDKDSFLRVGDFATQELHMQSKSVAAFLDGDEGQNPEYNLGEGLNYKGVSGNYSDMKIHIDSLDEFCTRVRKYRGS